MVENKINDEPGRTYDKSNQIKIKTSVIRSNLYNHSSAYIHVSGTITITGARDNDAAKRANEKDKGVIFKNCAPFTDCISNKNNTQIDIAINIDIMMPM